MKIPKKEDDSFAQHEIWVYAASQLRRRDPKCSELVYRKPRGD